jgi:hypothetical protein
MCQSFIRSVVFAAIASLAVAGQVSALPLSSSKASSGLVVRVQGDVENQEVWQDLRPDVTPPEASVGKEGETTRAWERATNQTDCEKSAGVWDAPNNKCSEKK